MRRFAPLAVMIALFPLLFAAPATAGSEDYRQRAEALQDQGLYREAIPYWDQHLAANSRDDWGYAKRGECYRRIGNYAQAIRDFSRALELDSEDYWDYAKRGESYRESGRYREAIEDFSASIRLKPDYSWAWAHRGQSRAELEQYSEAIADFTRAIEIKPDYDWAYAHRGEAWQESDRHDRAIEDFDRAIELDPEYEWAYAKRGYSYHEKGNYDRAIESYDRAVQLAPDDEWNRAHRADAYRLKGDCASAIPDFTRAIELDPEYVWAYSHRGRCHLDMERYDQAIADFSRALQLDPEDEWAVGQRGYTYHEKGDYDRAIEDFSRAIRLDSKDSWNYAHRGESRRQKGDYREAIRDFTRAIELKPKYDWAYAHRGEAYREAGEPGKAIEDFEKALQLDPNYSWAESQLKLAREAETAAPSRFKLFVETEPSDATVKIMNIKPRFHQGIELSPGRYALRVERAGYEPLDEVVYIEDSDLRLSYVLNRPEPPSTRQRLFVETRPSDATVKIEGVGAPFRQGMNLEPGRYSLRIEKEGFQTIEDSIELTDADMRLFYALQKTGITSLAVSESDSDNQGNVEPELPVEPRRRHWAVVIGVSEYADSRIPTLRYADVDAKAFRDWLVSPDGGRYAPASVKLLLNEQATATNIRNALFSWLRQAIEEDVVVIYFAGHGSAESPDYPDNLFLLPNDTDYDRVASTGFPMWDIETALKRFVRAKRVIVIADACHSGGVGQAFDVSRRAGRGIGVNRINAALENLTGVGDGVAVITAAGSDQTSQEGPQWGGGHGVFTHFLLQGLKGKADYDGTTGVTLGELIPYLSQQVRRETRNAQAPVIAGRFDPALGIGR